MNTKSMLSHEAINYINTKANEFLDKLELREKDSPHSTKREESSIDHRQSVELKDEDIQNLIDSTIDQEGTPLSFHFSQGDMSIGLSGDQYNEYFNFIKKNE